LNLKTTIKKLSPTFISAGISYENARRLGVDNGSRIKVIKGEKFAVSIVFVFNSLVPNDEIIVDPALADELKIKEGETVSVSYESMSLSAIAIRNFLSGEKLSKEHYYEIVKDTVLGRLSDVELTSFIVAQMYRKMEIEDIENLTRAMADLGEKISFDRTVYEKHSIGGVPGNKVSLLIVPIVAAAGLLIPKTSSRSITSPSGTADTMEVLAPVELSPQEFKEVALKVGGAIVWGGKLGLSPADDLFISRVEHPLSIDPISQLLASVMSKKLAVGVNYLVVDLPVGKGTKLSNEEEARELASKFIELGRRLGIHTVCGVTYGDQPVGHAVGPALEAREALEALEGRGPTSLREKATALAGLLLEASGLATRGQGKDLAMSLLSSGKALQKMHEIIEAQGGDPNIKPEDIKLGEHRASITSPADGYVVEVSNYAIKEIARTAGAPTDKGAGVLLYAKRGYSTRKGDKLLEIFSEHAYKLTEAISLAQRLKPITVEGMLLHRIPED